MAVQIVFETHQTTEDNEAGIATGWLPGRLSALGRGQAGEPRWDGARVLVVGHIATRLGLDHHLRGVPLEEALTEEFTWQPGWEYVLE